MCNNKRIIFMRIIAGKNKGTKLNTLDGNEITRPTLDRVKESLFNILLPYLENSYVLDLFSGSGALALEALSRGAKYAVICDKSYKAIKVIKENVFKTQNEENVYIINKDFEIALSILEKEKKDFDIIFLDPPYKTEYIKKSVNLIIKNKLIKKDGIIVIETDEKERILKQINNGKIEVYDIRKYGRVDIIFLRQKE
ncbi:MAG: 16S rRNA (guanine(966)-N(2))-methyltransferase RsmD [Candidatus Scatovivens sp.]